MKTVILHHSIRSCEGISNLFGHMFSDIEIAKSFTKCTYCINYGIAPYFKEILLSQLQAFTIFLLLVMMKACIGFYKKSKWMYLLVFFQ